MGALLDALLFAGQQNPSPAARILATGAQSFSNTTNTMIAFGQVDYDTSGGVIPDVANSRLIANRTGLWTVSLTMRFANNASAAERAIGIYKNGQIGSRITGGNGNFAYQVLNCSTTLRLATGDYIQGLAWQATGGSLNNDLTFEPTSMTLTFNGPS